jgi:hypothetical protein
VSVTLRVAVCSREVSVEPIGEEGSYLSRDTGDKSWPLRYLEKTTRKWGHQVKRQSLV